jgi:uncharacterized protein YneF (UPF0154 family)
MKKKILSYAVVLIVGLAIGLMIGVLMNNGQHSTGLLKTPNWSDNEITKAMPETMGQEAVNDEVIKLITDMYNNAEYLHIQKQVEKAMYPYKNIDKDGLEMLTSLFNEYEWRANGLNSYEASDFNLIVEIYTPDMAQVLTLYGGFDIVLYRDEDKEVTAYYTYLFSEEDVYADLAKRLQDFIDK